MEILADFSLSEYEKIVNELNEPKFRAKQLYQGILQGKKISEISTISASLKTKLLERYVDKAIEIYLIKTSKVDNTRKFIYKLHDGNIIEGVLMENNYGRTLCVSTQVGCRMGCKFCASTLGGLVRNLSAGEILSQVLVVNRELNGTEKKREITNLVLMGSGEPFDNYDNVVKFLRLVSDKEGMNFSLRNISLSTCGIVDKILQFSEENLPVNLCISLHAPNDEIRKQTMPIANKFSIKYIIEACKTYFDKTGRRIIFEYALVEGLNDEYTCAEELAVKLKNLNCHINIIPLNSVKERNLIGATRKKAYAFAQKLESLGISATVRRTMGEDIEGACGQLRNKIASND